MKKKKNKKMQSLAWIPRHPSFSTFQKSMVEVVRTLTEEHRSEGAFSLHLGHKRVVVMSDMDQVRRVYGRECTRRPVTSVGDWRENRCGLIPGHAGGQGYD